MEQLTDFQTADYFTSQEDIVSYLQAAFDEAAHIEDDKQSSTFIMAALSDAARARKKMTAIANRAHVGRESLYKSLRANANPSFRTMISAIRALGGQISIVPSK